jgi:hypothetical protein
MTDVALDQIDPHDIVVIGASVLGPVRFSE